MWHLRRHSTVSAGSSYPSLTSNHSNPDSEKGHNKVFKDAISFLINGLSQKRSITHQKRKFLLSRDKERNCLKNVLNSYRMSREGKGGVIVNFLHVGGVDRF